jgi:sugar lactone lactonase YvrE
VIRESKFFLAYGITLVQDDIAVVAEQTSGILYKVNIQTGQITHFSGKQIDSNSNRMFRDGSASEAYFYFPEGLAFEVGTNSVLVCDSRNHALRRVRVSDGYVTTVTGRYDGCSTDCGLIEGGYAEGNITQARFRKPSGVAVVPGGKYAVVADSSDHRIRLVDLKTGSTSLLAGSGAPMFADGIGSSASFALPYDVTVSNDGKTVYVADRMNNRIRSINMQTKDTLTIAGPGLQDAPPGTDGVGTGATLSQPTSLGLASDDWLIITDSLSNRIRMVPLTKGAVYESGKGFSYCPACPAGTASKTAGSLCEVCPENTYSSATATECTPCPQGSNTRKQVGSTSGAACVCNEDFYSGFEANKKQVCQKCPSGARCSDGTCALRKPEQTCGEGAAAKRIEGTWVMKSGEMRLVSCPAGSLVVNASSDTQTCLTCKASTYSFNSTDNCGKDTCVERECNTCPVGARCNGGDHFESLVKNSVWEKVVEGATVRMRLKTCPGGYVLVRSKDRPENDECVKCLPNTYMAEAASYDTGKGVSTSAAVLQDSVNLCLTCPAGSSCNGQDEVI